MIKTFVKDSPIHGQGYFANEDIPLGTIMYFYAEDDIRYPKEQFENLSKTEKDRIIEFAVEDEFGNWVETKSGPFTNHSCDANMLSLYVNGLYTDIAVVDIHKSDEITVDYAQFFSSTTWSMNCNCRSNCCRKTIGFGLPTNYDLEKMWEVRIRKALANLKNIEQPIFHTDDKYAKEISKALQTNQSPELGKHIKHSLIFNQ